MSKQTKTTTAAESGNHKTTRAPRWRKPVAGHCRRTFIPLDGETMELIKKLAAVIGTTRRKVIRLALDEEWATVSANKEMAKAMAMA